MLEEFNSYKEYKDYINKNWDRTYSMNLEIINRKLLVYRKINLNGEPFRMLTEEEFNKNKLCQKKKNTQKL